MRTLRLVESSEETNEHSWRESVVRGLEVGIIVQVSITGTHSDVRVRRLLWVISQMLLLEAGWKSN